MSAEELSTGALDQAKKELHSDKNLSVARNLIDSEVGRCVYPPRSEVQLSN